MSVSELQAVTQVGPYDGLEQHWPHWKFKFEAVIGGIRPDVLEAMRLAECCQEEMDQALLTEAAQSCSRTLFAWLALATSDTATAVVEDITDGCGLEAWRRLCRPRRSKAAGQNLGLLRKLSKFDFGTMATFETKALEFARMVKQYNEQSGEVFSQSSQKATLLESAPVEVRQHLQLFASSYPTFADMKFAVLEFIANANTWKSEAPAVNGTPMDVGALAAICYVGKGKAKGKGKGKGKFGKGKQRSNVPMQMGKASSSASGAMFSQPPRLQQSDGSDWMEVDEPNGPVCYECGGWGHTARYCGNKYFAEYVQGKGTHSVHGVEWAEDEHPEVLTVVNPLPDMGHQRPAEKRDPKKNGPKNKNGSTGNEATEETCNDFLGGGDESQPLFPWLY